MKWLRNIGAPWLAWGVAAGIASGQSGTGPGFDRKPVQIPYVQKKPPHPVTSLDLLNVRDFHGSQISPDGKWVAFVLGQAVYESNSYRSGLFIVSTEKGAKPISLGSAGPPHWKLENQWWPENPQWSADSKYVYYRLKNAETWQVWRWKREGGAPAQVTHFARSVQSFQIIPDGTKLAVAVEKPFLIDKNNLLNMAFCTTAALRRAHRGRCWIKLSWIKLMKDGEDVE